MIKKHWALILAVLAFIWIFHIHFNRGVPVKKNG